MREQRNRKAPIVVTIGIAFLASMLLSACSPNKGSQMLDAMKTSLKKAPQNALMPMRIDFPSHTLVGPTDHSNAVALVIPHLDAGDLPALSHLVKAGLLTRTTIKVLPTSFGYAENTSAAQRTAMIKKATATIQRQMGAAKQVFTTVSINGDKYYPKVHMNSHDQAAGLEPAHFLMISVGGGDANTTKALNALAKAGYVHSYKVKVYSNMDNTEYYGNYNSILAFGNLRDTGIVYTLTPKGEFLRYDMHPVKHFMGPVSYNMKIPLYSVSFDAVKALKPRKNGDYDVYFQRKYTYHPISKVAFFRPFGHPPTTDLEKVRLTSSLAVPKGFGEPVFSPHPVKALPASHYRLVKMYLFSLTQKGRNVIRWHFGGFGSSPYQKIEIAKVVPTKVVNYSSHVNSAGKIVAKVALKVHYLYPSATSKALMALSQDASSIPKNGATRYVNCQFTPMHHGYRMGSCSPSN